MSDDGESESKPLIWLQGHQEVGSTFDGHVVLDRDFRDSDDPAVIVSDLYQAAPDLRDALEELYGQLEPILAHERNVSFEAMEQARDALLAAGVDV